MCVINETASTMTLIIKSHLCLSVYVLTSRKKSVSCYLNLKHTINRYFKINWSNLKKNKRTFIIDLILHLGLILGIKLELCAYILLYRQTKLFSLAKELLMKCATDSSHIIQHKYSITILYNMENSGKM